MIRDLKTVIGWLPSRERWRWFALVPVACFAAIIEAAGTRLRPILMTSAATVVGHFPLVLAKGPGAGARNSIGVMLVSGMIIGSLFTLFVVPSIYMLVARKRLKDDQCDFAIDYDFSDGQPAGRV